MSEKPGKMSGGRTVVLAGMAAGALVAACDVRTPTELRDAIEEVRAVEAHESGDGSPLDATPSSNLARWFASGPAPLVFVDGVRVGRYEDLPEPVRRWSEGGLQEDGLIDRVEVMKAAAARELWGEEGAHGAIRIFMRDRPLDESDVEPSGAGRAELNRDNLWGEKFSRMADPRPLPLVMIDGVRVDYAANYTIGTYRTPLDPLDPGDIDRIEVIKGPAASFHYGEEALGGVILIYTRRGSQQRTGGPDA